MVRTDLWQIVKTFNLRQRSCRHAPVSADWSLVCSYSNPHKCGTYQPEKGERSGENVTMMSADRGRTSGVTRSCHFVPSPSGLEESTLTHPRDEAVTNILRELLIVHQLLQENAANTQTHTNT